MKNRLKFFQGEIITDKLVNERHVRMMYNSVHIWFQVVDYHWEGKTLYPNHSEFELEVNSPVIAKGITAYLLLHLGRREKLIFDQYYEISRNYFKQVEESKPGASMRNLDTEFYSNHISEEKEFIRFSQKIDEYISDNELETINKHTRAYLTYIEQVYSPTSNSTQLEKLIRDTIQAKKDWETSPTQKPLTPTKVFPEYLLHDKRDLLAEKLKTEFNTETGKGIRLMIESLQAHEPKLLSIENRQRKAIHTALKIFFNRDIGTRQSIFDYKFDRITDEIDFSAIRLKLNFILESINKTK